MGTVLTENCPQIEVKIAIIYDKFRDDTLGEHYKTALASSGHLVEQFWLKDSHKIEPVFDAYLRIDDGDYKYDIPHEKLRPAFFYASDTHLKKPFRAIKKAARFYDHCFCAQYSGYLELKRILGDRVSWLAHACDPEIHYDSGCGRKMDIAFVGNDGGIPRKFLLQELRERFPNSYIGNASYLDIAKIYSAAKIGFNYSISNDINMRMFEVMACGAMLLTNSIDDKGFGELFTERKNLVAYRSPGEIFSLIEYYLRNADEREEIARAGKELVREKHTYSRRTARILEVIKRYMDKEG